jgi:circadian clock protein KaiC
VDREVANSPQDADRTDRSGGSGGDNTPTERISTGISGLDEVLNGGLIAGRSYLVRGGPGCGKTTLGLHFLTARADEDEPTLFISLSEPAEQVREDAGRLGFDVHSITFLDLTPNVDFFFDSETYDIFSPAEVEREPTTRKIVEQMRQSNPRRVFIDSLTQFRYLAPDALQFRKQALSLLHFLCEQGATVIVSSEGTTENPDDDLGFMTDGVIELESSPQGRTVGVTKFRGSGFSGGRHTLRIGAWGIGVFPTLQPQGQGITPRTECLSSGVPSIDQMLGGGLERGTVTIITGPTGVGKTTLGLLFMKEAASRGERSVVYSFEENPQTLFTRCEAVSIPVRAMTEGGTLSVLKIEPLQYTTNEFAQMVRFQAEELRSRIVMIDSVAGYRLSLRGADLVRSLHALSRYLSQMGVTTLLINEVEAITGRFQATESGISYLADNIVFLRYLEVEGELQKAIGVLKKRLSGFEDTIRRMEITRYGLKVGEPFRLHGLLGGVPVVDKGGSA